MSHWHLYVCEDVSQDFTTMVVERFVGTFDTIELAKHHSRVYARPCRIREEPSGVRLNDDGTRSSY